MIETRLSQLRGGAPFRVALWVATLLLLSAVTLRAQTSAPVSTESKVAASTGEATPERDMQSTDNPSGTEECHAPTTQEKVIIGVGTLAFALFCFFLLVRLVQRHYIRRDRNATLGRHLGISLAFLVSSLGMVGLAYLVTGCLHRQFLFWLCFALALWLIHLIYTLVVGRNE
jgi:hypothetical protein